MKYKTKDLVKILRDELAANGIVKKEDQAVILGQAMSEMNFSQSQLKETKSDKAAEAAYGFSSQEVAPFTYAYKQSKKAKELGNTEAGEGSKYKGRGYIQLTGKANYQKIGKELFKDGVLDDPDALVKNPDLMLDPYLAAKASVKYLLLKPNFKNVLAQPDLRTRALEMTKLINGGLFKPGTLEPRDRKHEDDSKLTYAQDVEKRINNVIGFNKQMTLNEAGIPVDVDGIITPGGKTDKAWNNYIETEKVARVSKYPKAEEPQYETMQGLLQGIGEKTAPAPPSARAAYAQTDPRRVDLAPQAMPQAPQAMPQAPQAEYSLNGRLVNGSQLARWW
jgi:predicted chitinase